MNGKISYFYYESPLGVLEIAIEDDILIGLKFSKEVSLITVDVNLVNNIKTQLDEYFIGKRQKFDIKYELRGSEFQKQVWAELEKIPYGKTTSYFEIAKQLGDENKARAVGNACRKNPIIIIVPCHRVISKNGCLSGFAYGFKIKERLLQIEKII